MPGCNLCMARDLQDTAWRDLGALWRYSKITKTSNALFLQCLRSRVIESINVSLCKFYILSPCNFYIAEITA